MILQSFLVQLQKSYVYNMYNRMATPYIIRPFLTIFRMVFVGDALFVKYLHDDR
jgi:hypothetical protein